MSGKEDRRQQRISNNEFRTRNGEVRRVRRCDGREGGEKSKIKHHLLRRAPAATVRWHGGQHGEKLRKLTIMRLDATVLR
jgi:hypothetical protein